jgi:hypothetical protein
MKESDPKGTPKTLMPPIGVYKFNEVKTLKTTLKKTM